jgi:hypothetical protein
MNLTKSASRRLRRLIFPAASPVPTPSTPTPPKTWETSQDYELRHAIAYMNTDEFRSVISSDTEYGKLMVRQFFDRDERLWEEFKTAVSGKTGIDIGPCIWSPLASWDFLSRRIAIEPLGEKTKAFQREQFGRSFFDNLELLAHGADVFVPELDGKIDGIVYCRNMLDHTPKWPIVLANMSRYAAPGCMLLLWTDYNHHGAADEGHYEICEQAADLKRLVEQLGVEILREHADTERFEANWGCVAKKRDTPC